MAKNKLAPVTGTESLRKFFDSEFMGAYSIMEGMEPVVTIAGVSFGAVTLDAGRKEDHLVLSFHEKSVPGMSEVKPLILNATNQKTIEKMYGKGADAIINKRLKLYVDPAVKAIGGGTTEGIRIRPTPPTLQKEEVAIPPCHDCKKAILPANGRPAEYIWGFTLKNFDVPLCAECARIRTAAKKQEKQPEESASEPQALAEEDASGLHPESDPVSTQDNESAEDECPPDQVPDFLKEDA